MGAGGLSSGHQVRQQGSTDHFTDPTLGLLKIYFLSFLIVCLCVFIDPEAGVTGMNCLTQVPRTQLGPSSGAALHPQSIPSPCFRGY